MNKFIWEFQNTHWSLSSFNKLLKMPYGGGAAPPHTRVNFNDKMFEKSNKISGIIYSR